MGSTGARKGLAIVIVLAASLVAGAFVSRFLAENAYQRLGVFYHWPPTLSLMALVSSLFLIRHLLLSNRASLAHSPLRDAVAHLPLLLLAFYLPQREVNTLEATVLLVGALSLSISLQIGGFRSTRWLDRSILISLFVVPFAIYLITLAPTVGEHDTFEFQVVSYELGIAHPTGYPLYVMLGKLFTLLPIGNVAWRVNLSSAVFAASTVVVLYLTIYLLTRHRPGSALGSLAFAFSRSFWSQAIKAEVYALNALFFAVICYLVLRYFHHPPDEAQQSERKAAAGSRLVARLPCRSAPPRVALLYAIAFSYGLSLTHHRTMVLLAPALIAYVLLGREAVLLTLRRVLLLLATVVVPLVGVYLYIPIRWWQIHRRLMNWTDLSNLVLGTQFAAALRWDAWYRDIDRLRIYVRILLDQYPVAALMLATLGFLWMLWPNKAGRHGRAGREAVLLLVALLAYVIFGLSYYVPDISLFIIPSYMIIAIGLGLGIATVCRFVEELLGRLPRISEPARTTVATSLTVTLCGVLPLWLLWTNLPTVDSSDAYASYKWGRYVLQQDLPTRAVILADSEKMAPLHYLQRVEGVRSDTETAVFPDEETNRAELERRLREGRPVFLARFLPGLESTYRLRSLGPLVEVSTAPLTQPPSDIISLERRLGDKIVLRGYRLDSAGITATDAVPVTLYWQASEPVGQQYDVRLRLVGQGGHVWYQTNARPPVTGLYPTAAWHPGEIIADYHALDLQGKVPPGDYLLQVGLFPPFGQRALVANDENDGYLAVSKLSLSPSPSWSPDIDHPLRISFDDRIALLGYDFPAVVAPTMQPELTLYWRGIDGIESDYDVVLQLVDANNDVLWTRVEPPFAGVYPTSRWVDRKVLADVHRITVPSDAAGQLDLTIGLRDSETGQPLSLVDGWLGGQHDRTVLASIQLNELPPHSRVDEQLPANFENKVLLLDYEVQNVQVRKGGALRLSLTWQALTGMDQDYTVFIQILDDSDRIWGQQDTQPVYGTYPTSRWREGETVVDRHTVWTDPTAPLGIYRIEVGMYLLRTMERLQILGLPHQPIQNRVIIEAMEIVR